MPGLIQKHDEMAAYVANLTAQVDVQMVDLRERVKLIEEVLGLTVGAGGGNGRSAPPSEPYPTPYGGATEDSNVRLRRIEDALAELADGVRNLGTIALALERQSVLPDHAPVEIPKRQNPPPSVRRAAKMAAAPSRPATKRKR